MLKVLVTNDDGIHAMGIKKLVESLRNWAEVFVSAPSDERSAVGHGITVRTPLKAELISFHDYEDVTAWSVHGNPADCVKMAVLALMDEKPDMVISGVNAGVNLGKDIYYSGTVSAAREGVILGIPSLALSYDNHSQPGDFGEVENILTPLLKKIKPEHIPPDVLLNINIPHLQASELRGIVPVPLHLHHYSDKMMRKQGRHGEEYWLERKYDKQQMVMEDNDFHMLKNGFVTITPIHIDSTDLAMISVLNKWDWRI